MVSLDYSFSEPMKKDPRNRLQDEKRRKGEKDPNRVIGFATSLPFADESFDTIVASVSIPFYLLHDEEIEKAFSEIARVLRPQGKGYFHPINHIKEIKEYHPDGHYGGTPHEKYTSEEVQPVLEAILDKLKDKITYEFHRALYQDRFHDLKLIKDISLEITKI
jgi:ubiquinone/menaquinone biosynthesis C-methylase UbiE